MSVQLNLSEADLQKLRHFHQTHFSNQPVPATSITAHDEDTEYAETNEHSDGLGYYEDGTRRTLTDEQIAMFRHSEIQRLLKQRRQAQHRREREAARARKLEGKRAGKPNDRRVHANYMTDEHVHATEQVNELAYDEEMPSVDVKEPKTFRWPVLPS